MYTNLVSLVSSINASIDPRKPASCQLVTRDSPNNPPEVIEFYNELSKLKVIRIVENKVGLTVILDTQIPVESCFSGVTRISTRYGKLALSDAHVVYGLR